MGISAEKCPSKIQNKLKKGKGASSEKPDLVLPDIDSDAKESDTGNGGGVFLCCKCMKIVTFASEKTAVNGSYNHGFANPHGLFFEISCFKNAPGCVYSNESSSEFTWFKGFSWRIAACRGCMNHLGWLFTSAKSSFHGLIADRLVLRNE